MSADVGRTCVSVTSGRGGVSVDSTGLSVSVDAGHEVTTRVTVTVPVDSAYVCVRQVACPKVTRAIMRRMMFFDCILIDGGCL